MTPTLEHLHKELMDVKTDVALIKHILVEEGELTSWAKNQLKEARQTPEHDHINLCDMNYSGGQNKLEMRIFGRPAQCGSFC